MSSFQRMTNESRISVHFFVLLVLLASSAFAGELSSEQQIDALRAELTASRARNEQLNGKIEQLNAMLKSQNGQQKAEKVLLEASGKVGKLDNADTASAHDPFSSETCSDHCNGDCSIATYKIDKDCVATKRFIDSTKRKVVSVGTSTHPKWHLYNTWATKKGARIVGSVECPCTASNGNPMDYPTALSHILGQMGAMGLDAHIANKVATKAKDWKGATEKGATYVTSLGYTAVLMINCWQKTCASPASTLNGELSLTSLLQDEDANKMDFGGGAMC